jgi:hypothetical protein
VEEDSLKKELSPQVKAFMAELIVNPIYKKAMQEISEMTRPVVPSFKPGMNQEENFSLLERIKYESGRKEGFDLLYLRLTGDRNE